MKIIGFVYNKGEAEMILKGDSSLLNGRKPMFIPEWTHELGVTECVILRVSRLGKEIGLKFASRYYDACAPGADFIAIDKIRELQAAGRPWTQAIGFDYSLAIGEMADKNEGMTAAKLLHEELIMTPEEAIVEASRVMTIRQGDLIYIQKKAAPQRVEKEDIIRIEIDGKEKLYCKIK
jgi:hypothetical protein